KLTQTNELSWRESPHSQTHFRGAKGDYERIAFATRKRAKTAGRSRRCSGNPRGLLLGRLGELLLGRLGGFLDGGSRGCRRGILLVVELLDGFLCGRADDLGTILEGAFERGPCAGGTDLAEGERRFLADLVVAVGGQHAFERQDNASSHLA